MQDLCRQPLMAKPPLPTAADGKGNFANSGGRQSSHAVATCASWEVTHLASLPTAVDDKGFSYSGGRQRVNNFAYSRGRQRPAV